MTTCKNCTPKSYMEKWNKYGHIRYIESATVQPWDDWAWSVKISMKDGGTNSIAMFPFDKTDLKEKEVAREIAEKYAVRINDAKEVVEEAE